MSFYKLIKISILLGTGILIACSPEKTEVNSTDESQQSNTQIKTKLDGLKVYIDPVTGERLSGPPVNTDSTIQLDNAKSTSTDQTIYFSEPKKSTVPGVGVYIELEAPPLTVNNQ